MAKTSKRAKPVIYRHTSHAEWGLGMIVEETAAKVYVAFEDGGRRPFLNVQKYRELLVPADVGGQDVDEIVAKITKGLPKPPTKAAQAKKKKAAVAKAAAAEEEDALEGGADEEEADDEPSDDE